MVNITPLNITHILQAPDTGANQSKKMTGLQSDVFVKTQKPETKANDFIDWAEKTDFINGYLPILLLNPEEHLIGSGFSHKTYSIPENEEYILRTSNCNDFRDIEFGNTKLIDTQDNNLKINIGQKVADIILKNHHGIPFFIEVLKKQEGKPIGVPPARILYSEETGELKEGVKAYEDIERKRDYADSLDKLSRLPLDAYEQLIDDLQEAAKAGYSLDHLNSNNLMIDSEHERINLIDMDKTNMGVNYGNVLYALTNIDYYQTFASQHGPNPSRPHEILKAIEDTIYITGKFMLAMKKKGVKFPSPNSSYEFKDFLRSIPMAYMVKEPNELIQFDDKKVMEYFKINGVA